MADLPIDEAGFRETEPSYYEVQSHLGWQSQTTIDQNLYTKYLETWRQTLINELKQLNMIQQEMTHTLFMWLSYHDTTTLHDNLVIS